MSKHCDICDIDLNDDYSYHGHLMGKKHLKAVDRMNYKKRLESNSIFLGSIPPRISEEAIIEFFSQFGPILRYKFLSRCLIVEFETSEPAEYLLQNPIYFNRYKLNIRKRTLDSGQQKTRSPKKSSEKRSPKHYVTGSSSPGEYNIKRDIEQEPSWEAQLSKFLSIVQDDDATIQACCKKLCESLDSVLEQTFPHGRSMIFGTAITGLHLKHSDVDIFYDIGMKIHEEKQKITLETEKNWTMKSIFREIKNNLYKYKSLFSQIVSIPSAKIPVIKFHYLPTKTDCDISFKHGLGVRNSQLIKHYLTLDERLKPLMLIIKYWAYSLQISGTGKITNYSLVMAIIFYLQRPDVNLLPTVKKLQASCEPLYINNWLVSFDRNIKPDTSKNGSTIIELLHGFFKFYAAFNFSINVICPLDGSIVPKTTFIKNMMKTKLNVDALNMSRPVCIQDPFELDHNVAEGWTNRLIQNFQRCCAEGVQLCESGAEDNYKSLLPSICEPTFKYKAKVPKSTLFTVKAGNFGTFGLPEEFATLTDEKEKSKIIENNWLKIVYKLLEKIFTNVFKFELQIMYSGISLKQMKVEENSDVHSENNDKILLLGRGKYCLNRLRQSKVPLLDSSLSCIEKETLISDNILAVMGAKKKQNAMSFVCSLEKKTSPLHILVSLTNEGDTNEPFSEIGNYIRAKVPVFIEKELEHMIQYKKQLSL